MVVLVQISSELFEYGCMAKLVYIFFITKKKSHQSISRHVFLTGKCWIWMDDFQTSSYFQPQKKSQVNFGWSQLWGWGLMGRPYWEVGALYPRFEHFTRWYEAFLRYWEFEKVFVQDNCSRKTDWLVQLSHMFTHILVFQLAVSLIFVSSCRHHGRTLVMIGADWVFHHLGRQIFTCHSGEWVAWQQD